MAFLSGDSNESIRTGTQTTRLLNLSMIEHVLKTALATTRGDLSTQFERGLEQLSAEQLASDRGLLEPFREGGIEALNRALGLQGLGPNPVSAADLQSQFLNTPGIQFAQEQGRRGIQASASARGLLGSGREAKELGRFNMGLAGQFLQQQHDNLARLAGIGSNAAAQSAGLGSQQSQARAGLLTSLGQSLSGAELQVAGLRTGALSQEQITSQTKSERQFRQESMLRQMSNPRF